MPIRWSTLKVSEACDMIDEYINQAAEPLEQARLVANEALKIENLPQYVTQDFGRLLGDIAHAIGGSQWEPVGRFRSGVAAIRKSLPADAVKQEQEFLAHGRQQALTL